MTRDEDRLRELLGAQETPRASIDADEIVRRARRRRRPKQWAVGAGSAVAACSLVAVAVLGLPNMIPDTALIATDSRQSGADMEAPAAPESDSTPYAVPECGPIVSTWPASDSRGLSLESDLEVSLERVTGTVTVSMSGTEELQGTVTGVGVALTDDDGSLWQAHTWISESVSLSAGDEWSLEIDQVPLACEVTIAAPTPASWVTVIVSFDDGDVTLVEELD